MQSKITIEIDFSDNNTPFIQISESPSSDVRDQLICSFLQSLGYESTWCKIVPSSFNDGYPKKYSIKAIKSQQFEEEAKIMAEQARVHNANEEKFGHLPSIKPTAAQP